MVVHSFNTENLWFCDYQRFLEMFGVGNAEIGILYRLPNPGHVQLYSCWAKGDPSFLLPDWVEFRKERQVIWQLVEVWFWKLKSDPVALLYQAVIDRIRLPEPTSSILVVVAILAICAISNKYLFDVHRGILDILPVFVDCVQEQAQQDTILPDVNAGVDLIAFEPRFAIDEHVLSPAVATADLVAEVIAKPVQLSVECVYELFIGGGDEIELGRGQWIDHECLLRSTLVNYARSSPEVLRPWAG
jgi:hypothetical protein